MSINNSYGIITNHVDKADLLIYFLTLLCYDLPILYVLLIFLFFDVLMSV